MLQFPKFQVKKLLTHKLQQQLKLVRRKSKIKTFLLKLKQETNHQVLNAKCQLQMFFNQISMNPIMKILSLFLFITSKQINQFMKIVKILFLEFKACLNNSS